MNCRHCGQPLHTYEQHYPAKYNLKPLTYVECRNTNCELWMMTFTMPSYQTKDLTPYLRGKDVKYYE